MRINQTAIDIHENALAKGFYDESPERDEIDLALAAILRNSVGRWCVVVERIRKTGYIPGYLQDVIDQTHIKLGSDEAKVAARLMLIVTECAEGYDALELRAQRKDHNLGEEVADVGIRTLDLAEFVHRLGLASSPDDEIGDKMETNAKRGIRHGKHA